VGAKEGKCFLKKLSTDGETVDYSRCDMERRCSDVTHASVDMINLLKTIYLHPPKQYYNTRNIDISTYSKKATINA